MKRYFNKGVERPPLRPDYWYGATDLEVSEIIGDRSFTAGMDVISSLKLKTIGDYERANLAFDDFRSLTKDIGGLKAFDDEIKRKLFGNTEKIDTRYDKPTHIWASGYVLTDYMIRIAPSISDSEEKLETLAKSFAGVSWIQANVAGTRNRRIENSLSALDLLDRSQKYYDEIIQYAEKFQTMSAKRKLNEKAVSKSNRPVIDIKVPSGLLIMHNIYNIVPKVSVAFQAISKSISKSVDALSGATSALFSWGDFKSNPLGTIVNVMGGYMTAMTAGMKMGSAFLDASGTIIASTSELFDKKKTKKSKEYSPETLLVKTVAQVGQTVISVFSSGINILSSMITMSLEMFLSLLDSLMKITKSIMETSEMFKAILSYLNLALTLFFLPFFTAFGEPILNAVMNIFDKLTSATTTLSSYFQTADSDINKNISESLEGVYDFIESLNVNFDELKESFSNLVGPMKVFILKFTKTIIDNSESISDLLTTGIGTFKVLLAEGIIEKFIALGVLIFEWIIENKDFVKSVVDVTLNLILLAMNFAQTIIKDLKRFVLEVLPAVGAVCGAIAGAQAGIAASWFTFGLSIVACTAIGATIGASAGLASAVIIVTQFINPVERDMMKMNDLKTSKYAEGGKIYGRDGGKVGLIGEAGEGEYIIPKSKMKQFRGDNNIIIRFNGKVYKERELDNAIKELTMEMPEKFQLN